MASAENATDEHGNLAAGFKAPSLPEEEGTSFFPEEKQEEEKQGEALARCPSSSGRYPRREAECSARRRRWS